MKATFLAVCLLAVLADAAPAPPTEPRPLIQYDQRYQLTVIDTETLAIFDSATGIIWLGQQAKYSFDTWRRYDLTKLAAQRKMPAPIVPAAFSNTMVYGRYTLRAQPGVLVFLDTLSGRVWSCRQSKGLLDVWKCFDAAGIKADSSSADED
jgi:hypothetical protein